MLFIIATPIGNLKDISLRAIEVLKSVDLIACEDTRHSKILLDEYGISTPLLSYYQHNVVTRGRQLLEQLQAGKNIALVSDAGTPGILDPGYQLINAAIEQGLAMTLIPGPVAFINALVLSGKPAHSFVFEGFLPPRSLARRNRLGELLKIKRTIIFYESCHRIIRTLEDLEHLCPEKEIACARELTKKFEEVRRGTPRALKSHFQQHPPKGEFVVVI